jgi:hypothetical protein
MKQNARCKQRLRELTDVELPADELERLARVDALLRVAAAGTSFPAVLVRREGGCIREPTAASKPAPERGGTA